MATLMDEGEINIPKAKELASKKRPTEFHMLLSEVAVESINHVEEINGNNAARAAVAVMEEIVRATTTDLSGDIEHDDHEVETKQLPGGNVKTTKKRIKGTVKEAVRGLKSTISLTKLLSVDPLLREYLLYVILNVLNAMGSRLKLPPDVRPQNVTAEHWR